MGRDRRGRKGLKRKHTPYKALSKKQKSHLKQYGEEHPAEDKASDKWKRKKILDEKKVKLTHHEYDKTLSTSEEDISDEDVQDNPFNQLKTMFGFSAGNEVETSESEGSEGGSDDEAAEDTKLLSSDNSDVDLSDDEASGGVASGDDLIEEEENDKEENTSDEEAEWANDETDEVSFSGKDPFTKHFEEDLTAAFVTSLKEKTGWEKIQQKIPPLGHTTFTKPMSGNKREFSAAEKDLEKLHVKASLAKLARPTNINAVKAKVDDEESLTAFQNKMFIHMNQYQDMYYADRSFENCEEIRLVYCLHAVNHILKTRGRIIGHNAKIKSKYQDLDDDFRDQGLTRPKVLMLLPFKDSALKAVKLISKLLFQKDKMNVQHKFKFKREYGEENPAPKGKKPEDYEATFEGNVDDDFCIGLAVSKRSLKLYTDMYSSDIIISSPVALRTKIGADGEEDHNFDFLSSIEVLIVDQADIFLMQNWDHVLVAHIFIPSSSAIRVAWGRLLKSKNVDIEWLVKILPPDTAAQPHCYTRNELTVQQALSYYEGKLQVHKQFSSGSICNIIAQLPQMFHRISATSLSDVPDARFEFFKSKILPQYKESVMSYTLIFVPSYFDYVRLRNYMKKKEYSVQHICEYTNKEHLTRARSFFYHGKSHFLLYTERLHFYHRYKIKGIRHLIFYDIPTYPQFYSELCNMVDNGKMGADSGNAASTCNVLYSKFDAQKLSAIVGTDRASHMLHSEKNIHMFVTGDT